MLTIEKVASGGDYHAYLTKNYYFDQAQHTAWLGRGAEALGLRGEVTAGQFSHFAAGYGLDGQPLVQNAGDDRRVPAWDLTFSAPKDVSALWAVASDDVKRIIEQCHREAVASAIEYLEEKAGQSRQVGQGPDTEKETFQVRAKLTVGTFEDYSSREGDPLIHTHAILFNCGLCDDGETRALHTRAIYRHKMAAGALYQVDLARHLVERLGLEITTEKHGFSIKGVVKALAKEWSKRSEQIREVLKVRGDHSAEAAAVAALETRKGKESAPEPGIFNRWMSEAARHGFGPEQVRALLGRASLAPEQERRKHIDRVVGQTAEKLLASESHFSERELLRGTADGLRDGKAKATEIRQAVDDWLKRPEVTAVGQRKDETRYTTRAVIDLERGFLDAAKQKAAEATHPVSERYRRKVVERHFPLQGVSSDDRERNKGQREAVNHITGPEGISVLSGMAGTGKSTVLAAARKVWEHQGYTVHGMALAGIAAKNLKEASGIESETLAMRLKQLEPKGLTGTVWHHAKQIAKTAANELHKDCDLPVYKPSFKLTAKSVVVLDEAGMVGTADMARLLGHVRAAGAKLVLVGDSSQLQPIAAGSPFRRLESELGSARLTHITRQKPDLSDHSPYWRREAVQLFEKGQGKEALAEYAGRGFVSVEANRNQAAQKLVSDWAARGGLKDPKNHLILASTNEDVRLLNALCQKDRLKDSDIGTRLKSVGHSGEQFHAGDRVLFTTKNRSLGVDNGDIGTIDAIASVTSRRLSVRVDDGRKVVVPLNQYGSLQLGYAVTTHKAQGTTVDHSYMLAGGPMTDLHLSYVQASRARHDTRFYVDRFEAGPSLERLSKAMSEARPKEMAHDLFRPAASRHYEHEMSR